MECLFFLCTFLAYFLYFCAHGQRKGQKSCRFKKHQNIRALLLLDGGEEASLR